MNYPGLRGVRDESGAATLWIAAAGAAFAVTSVAVTRLLLSAVGSLVYRIHILLRLLQR